MPTIRVSALTVAYEPGQEAVLKDVNFQVSAGQFAVLTGPSGEGKSTLLKLLAGLYPTFRGHIISGQILLDSHPLSTVVAAPGRQVVAMMFQDSSLQFTMDTVAHELIFALENLQVAPEEMPQRVENALAFVGIEDLKDREIAHLSGGEKQKVALAIIVAMDSDIILLDEPFASVDPQARLKLMTSLVQLATEKGKTVILADHDLSGYARYQDLISFYQVAHQQVQPLTSTELNHLFRPFTADITTLSLPSQDLAADLSAAQLRLQRGQRLLIDQSQLALPRKHTTLLTGPNGSGKSTFFNALVRLTPYEGRILFRQQSITKIRRASYARHVGLMFQEADTQFLNVTVAEELALSSKFGRQDYFSSSQVTSMLADLHLAELTDRVVYSLSGGQKKKLQLICMLMMAPEILLLDEPFAGLDLTSLAAVTHLLRQVQSDLGLTYLIISHQLVGVTPLVDYHLALADHTLTFKEAWS